MYYGIDPGMEGVTHVLIVKNTPEPYVFGVFFREPPEFTGDLEVLSIAKAMEIYEFVKDTSEKKASNSAKNLYFIDDKNAVNF